MDRYTPLRARTITLVGLMGVGKSSVGRRLANALELPFQDADVEIEAAAGVRSPTSSPTWANRPSARASAG